MTILSFSRWKRTVQDKSRQSRLRVWNGWRYWPDYGDKHARKTNVQYQIWHGISCMWVLSNLLKKQSKERVVSLSNPDVSTSHHSGGVLQKRATLPCDENWENIFLALDLFLEYFRSKYKRNIKQSWTVFSSALFGSTRRVPPWSLSKRKENE